MAAPTTRASFVKLLRQNGISESVCLDACPQEDPAASDDPATLADEFVRYGLLTSFQAKRLLHGEGLHVGDYRVLEPLGCGGTCRVFLGEHLGTGRLVALKVLFPHLKEDMGAILRLRREALATGALEHPTFIRLYDIDCDADPPFLVLEYVPGPSLEELVRTEGPLDFAQAVSYARQIAEGLQFALEAGWIHRDIKPSNLLLDAAGTVKILDLGLARCLADDMDNVTGRYDARDILGTADYLAPEQAADSHAVDIRADIYSLGATLYFLLAGHSPFPNGTPAQKILWHQLREPTDLSVLRPSLHRGLTAVVRRMMAKHPSDRYQTPTEVLQALSSLRAQAGAPESPWPHCELSALLTAVADTEPVHGGAVCPSPFYSACSIVIGPWMSSTLVSHRNSVWKQFNSQVYCCEFTSHAEAPLPCGEGESANATRRSRAAVRRLAWAIGAVSIILAICLAWRLLGVVRHTASPELTRWGATAQGDPTKLPLVQAADAASHVNEVCVVDLQVASTGSAATVPAVFLNSERNYRDSKNFTVMIVSEGLEELRAKGITSPKSYFYGRRLRVQGTISLYHDRPQVVVTRANAIQAVPE